MTIYGYLHTIKEEKKINARGNISSRVWRPTVW